jgi:uroporphyrinogen decarboxylase
MSRSSASRVVRAAQPPLCGETGIDAIGCDQGLPLDWIKTHLQDLVTVQGNLDPVLLVAGGRRLDERVREILDALSPRPFVFNLGHGILRDASCVERPEFGTRAKL